MKSNVKALVEAKGITVRAICERTGLSIQTVMTARTCGPKGICKSSMDTLAKIANELGVSVLDLFTDQYDPECLSLDCFKKCPDRDTMLKTSK